MGLFSRLLFWKKEEPDFENLVEKEFPAESLNQNQEQLEKTLFPPEDDLSPPRIPTTNRDLELINSKLDTLKAMLASIEQRLNNIEQVSAAEKKQRLW